MSRQRDYDSTVARIAGNIFSGIAARAMDSNDLYVVRRSVEWSVSVAKMIVAVTKESGEPVEAGE